MSIFKINKEVDDCFVVKGDLTFFTVNKKDANLLVFTRSVKELCVDLEGVKLADSAGLALIIEWIKDSKIHGTNLKFRHVPNQLQILAKLGGFEISKYIADI